ADVDLGLDVGALADHEDVVGEHLALEPAVDADCAVERELAFERGPAPEQRRDLALSGLLCSGNHGDDTLTDPKRRRLFGSGIAGTASGRARPAAARDLATLSWHGRCSVAHRVSTKRRAPAVSGAASLADILPIGAPQRMLIELRGVGKRFHTERT